MPTTILALLGTGLVWLVFFKLAAGMRRNLALARRSGLPYYAVPVPPVNPLSQMSSPVWTRLWRWCLPLVGAGRHAAALDVAMANWHWRSLYAPFARLGDTFLLVHPWGLLCYTCDPGVIHQVTSRRGDFAKPVEVYRILEVFGRNLVSTDGQEWRKHRRVTAPSFDERANALVFREAVHQTRGLLDEWEQKKRENTGEKNEDRGQSSLIDNLEADVMSMTLNIIGYVGFGLRFLWPGQRAILDESERLAKYTGLDAPPGHTMSFKDSIAHTMDHMLLLILTPKLLMDHLPFQNTKLVRKARDNYIKFVNDLIVDKENDLRRGDKGEGMDLLGSLVASRMQQSSSKNETSPLTHSDITGDTFVLFVAGHETTGNVLHFAMLLLANRPATQRRLQRDIDRILGPDTDPATWDYEDKINAMMGSTLGAVLYETLRWVPPVVEIPKKTHRTRPQNIVVAGGGEHELPPDTYIGLNTVGAHRHPDHWPGDDLDEWVPERWFRPSLGGGGGGGGGGGEKGEGGAGSADDNDDDNDTSAELFRPARGAFVPFSAGSRSCVGRRVAQVETAVALAVIFQRYSLENAVDEDDGGRGGGGGVGVVAEMDRAQKAALYARAVERSREVIKGATALVTLKLHGKKSMPVRLVRRGEERFVSWIGEGE